MAITPTQPYTAHGMTSTPEHFESKKEEFSKITEDIKGHQDHAMSESYNRKERYEMTNAELIALMNSQDKKDEGMLGWNNPFFYLIFIWLFASMGNFGGLGAKQQELSNDFLYTNLAAGQEATRSQISAIGNGICNSTYELSSKIDNVNYQNALQTQTLSSEIANCCCATNRNIDALANQVTMESAATREAIWRDGEATRALINANTLQAVRDQLVASQLALSNASQTQAISQLIDSKVADVVGYPTRPSCFFPYPSCPSC